MSDDSQRPIVIKRIKKGGHGHHGGAWKIAYADFVTAMMAFFLLMWLLSSSSKALISGISGYFQNPVKTISGGPGVGSSNSVLSGGGMDLTRQAGTQEKTLDDRKAERKRLASIKAALEKAAQQAAVGALAQYKDQLKFDLTPDGLRIQIVDSKQRALFRPGSDTMENYAREIFSALAPILDQLPNKVSIAGYTDASATLAGEQSSSTNWEISANRANSARRELVGHGLEPDKVLRVEGLGDKVPYDDDPFAPVNRRISITVLTLDAEISILKSGSANPDMMQQDDDTQPPKTLLDVPISSLPPIAPPPAPSPPAPLPDAPAAPAH